jgi:hypothetical protein
LKRYKEEDAFVRLSDIGPIQKSQALFDYTKEISPEWFIGKTIPRASTRSMTLEGRGEYYQYIQNCKSGECMLAALCVYFEMDLVTPDFYDIQSKIGRGNGKSKVLLLFKSFLFQ